MVILGLLVATDSLARHFKPGEAGVAARAFYTVPLAGMLAFLTLIYFAFRNRFNPAAHKRLILIATMSILDAAFDRWPIPVSWWGHRATSLICMIPLLLLVMGYDRWSTGKIHRATLWASVFLVVQQVRDPIGRTTPWQSFATSIQNIARSFH